MPPPTQPQTVQTAGNGFYEELGSKFRSSLHPVRTAQEVAQFVDVLAASQQASHTCYAYRLADGTSYATDDGEPAHSAGDPILRRLRSQELVNACCLVLRFFGGKKLGIPGLIRAYGTAAAEAIANAELAPYIPMARFRLSHAYEQTRPVERLLTDYDARLEEATYGQAVELSIALPKESAQAFVQALHPFVHQLEEGFIDA